MLFAEVQNFQMHRFLQKTVCHVVPRKKSYTVETLLQLIHSTDKILFSIGPSQRQHIGISCLSNVGIKHDLQIVQLEH
jgi:hypothetical protein